MEPGVEKPLLDKCAMFVRDMALTGDQVSELVCPRPVCYSLQLCVFLLPKSLLSLPQIHFSGKLDDHSFQSRSVEAKAYPVLHLICNGLQVTSAQDIVYQVLVNATVHFFVVESVHFESEKLSLLHVDDRIAP